MQRNVRQVGIRLSSDEKKLVEAICDALSYEGSAVSPSQLFSTAGLDEASTLGFTTSNLEGPKRRPPGLWKHKPDRSYSALNVDERKKDALTITIHPLHLGPIAKAAEWAQVKVPTFLWGALMAWTARRKKAEPQNENLQRVELPAQYEPR